jgi:hypothetical protein
MSPDLVIPGVTNGADDMDHLKEISNNLIIAHPPCWRFAAASDNLMDTFRLGQPGKYD